MRKKGADGPGEEERRKLLDSLRSAIAVYRESRKLCSIRNY